MCPASVVCQLYFPQETLKRRILIQVVFSGVRNKDRGGKEEDRVGKTVSNGCLLLSAPTVKVAKGNSGELSKALASELSHSTINYWLRVIPGECSQNNLKTTWCKTAATIYHKPLVYLGAGWATGTI